MLGSYGRYGTDAYDLVDRLPHGAARTAAWNAFVCQTYADKLAAACPRPSDETARVVRALYDLARAWLDRSRAGTGGTLELPPWGTPVRSRDQLAGMRETLYALRARLDPQPTVVDKCLESVDALWIARPTPELRGGIGDILTRGIREAAALGSQPDRSL